MNSLCEAVLTIYNEDVGDNLTVDDIKDYYIEKYVKPETRETFYEYFTDKRVWKRIKLIDNCVDIIKEFYNSGHDIYFVTSTEAENVYKKSKWLQRNFPFLNIRKRLICIHNKKLLEGLDVLVDDYLGNLVGSKYHKIVLTIHGTEMLMMKRKD